MTPAARGKRWLTAAGEGGGRWLLWLLLLALGSWIALADPVAPFGRLSWQTYDAAQGLLAPPSRHDPRIVIVDIDDEALRQHGRWPWPRERLAALIEAVQAAEPATLGLDILLPDKGETQGDRQLADALAADNLVTATAFGDIRSGPPGEPPRAERELLPNESLRRVRQRPALGHITPLMEGDGHIRRLYARICGPAPGCRDTLSLAMLEAWTGLPAQPTADGSRLCVGPFCQALDDRQRLLIPYQHPSRFDYLGAADVLAGKHRERLAGRLVLIGTSAAGLGDLVATPRGALTPGVELHAILLAAFLDRYPWQVLPYARAWLLTGLAALALIVPPDARRLGARRAWRGVQAGVIAALITVPPLLVPFGWWLAPWPWWLAVGAVGLLWLGRGNWHLWRRQRRLYRRFGAYVPHSVLRQLAEQGGEHPFTPQRRPLVILFSDIRGFTALSERLPPERLAFLTNHLFSELTEVVHAHGGTLDKYIGDALMAFWGAPLARDDDALRALACARAMHARLVNINRWCRDHDFPPIAMNIGLEAGPATVGNLGSRQRLAYTALGYPVNLASRLEELAGSLEEPVLIGPGLAEALPTSPLECLAAYPLKGVSEPVRVWRPDGSET